MVWPHRVPTLKDGQNPAHIALISRRNKPQNELIFHEALPMWLPIHSTLKYVVYTSWSFMKSMPESFETVTKWVETLNPKGAFWRFPYFRRGNIAFPPPFPPYNVLPHVEATFRKQQTPKLWIEGTGEGSGFLCSLKLPYLSSCLKNFVADCSFFL